MTPAANPLPYAVPPKFPRPPAGPRILAACCSFLAFGVIIASVSIDAYDRYSVSHRELVLHNFAGFDADFTRLSKQARTVYITFSNFHNLGASNTSAIYFRAAYVMYPTRVLVGDPDSTINTTEQILAANNMPDDSWLKQHDVDVVLTFFNQRGFPRTVKWITQPPGEIPSSVPRHDR